MGLPGVKITLDNGSLGGVPASNDGISGLILTGVTVAGANKVTIGNAYGIFSLDEAITLGIEETGSNAYSYSHIKEFYDRAGTGSELWIMLAASTVTMADMLDKTKAFAPVLIDASQGNIKNLGVSSKSVNPVLTINGLNQGVDPAMIKGQELANEYANKFKPFRFVVDGHDFSGIVGELKDYRTASFNRGAVLLAATSSNKNASIGFAIGSLAALPVQRKLSRVKNGALPISEAYFTNTNKTETLESAWDAIHDKGYIFFRTFANRSGYYFSSDTTATSLTDDYSSLSRGRVIDKATRIAYDVFVEEVDDEIDVDDEGKLNLAEVKSLQEAIVTRLELQMVGEISGVDALIDPEQNVLSTEKLNIVLKVRPVGYKRYIDILLGFENPALN